MSDPIYKAQALEIAKMAEHIDKLNGLVRQYHSAMCCMCDTDAWSRTLAYLKEQMRKLGIEVE